jgi:outer membrane protein OmpA-like peptidoglycan-associated protein
MSSPSATIPFAHDDIEVDVEAFSSLDAITGAAWSDLATRILIVGLANERRSLSENLELAERRARLVADHLMSRGVPRRQILVVAREASPGDAGGSRCDVEVIGLSLRTL